MKHTITLGTLFCLKSSLTEKSPFSLNGQNLCTFFTLYFVPALLLYIFPLFYTLYSSWKITTFFVQLLYCLLVTSELQIHISHYTHTQTAELVVGRRLLLMLITQMWVLKYTYLPDLYFRYWLSKFQIAWSLIERRPFSLWIMSSF